MMGTEKPTTGTATGAEEGKHQGDHRQLRREQNKPCETDWFG